MNNIFEYPSEGWSAESSYDAGFLALAIPKVSSQVGINAGILNSSNPFMFGYDNILQFSGVRIELKNQDYGCSLQVVITNEEKIERGFFVIWKYFVDKDIFWGGPYRRDLTAKKNMEDPKAETSQNNGGQDSKQVVEKHWEAFIKEDDMKKVFLFCTTDFALGELENKLIIGAGNGKRLSVDLSMLRKVKKFPQGKEERQDYLKKWKTYLQQASKEEREKYKEMTERFLPNNE